MNLRFQLAHIEGRMLERELNTLVREKAGGCGVLF
jgi:hypothetical protein